jgi:hypothetical protein
MQTLGSCESASPNSVYSINARHDGMFAIISES